MLDALVVTLDSLQLRDVARETIASAKERFPAAQWVRQAIVQRHWQAGYLDDALAEIEQAESDFSTLDTGLLRLKALVLAASSRNQEAEAALREYRAAASELEEDAVNAWCDALGARMALSDANWSAVMQKIEQAIGRLPADPTLRMARGEACAAVGELTQATESFAEAMRLDPNWVAAGLAQVRVLLKIGPR